MKIIDIKLNELIDLNEPIAACIGYFDGVHLGHQALINKTKELAKINKIRSCLITFNPDPHNVLEGQVFKHIESFDERLKLIASFDFDYCLILNFNQQMADLSVENFYDQILSRLPLKYLVCGFDFHYGYKGQGNYETLAKQAKDNFEVIKIDSVDYQGQKISSSRIRKAIAEGDLNFVSKLLGYQYALTGLVIHGRALGREIGYPTANLQIDEEVLLPKSGVYLGYAIYQNHRYRAMVSIGNNPTVKENLKATVEVHLLDFKEDIYQEIIRLEICEWLREIIHFNSMADLKHQLEQDEIKARMQ